jgi:hypothetical protein
MSRDMMVQQWCRMMWSLKYTYLQAQVGDDLSSLVQECAQPGILGPLRQAQIALVILVSQRRDARSSLP